MGQLTYHPRLAINRARILHGSGRAKLPFASDKFRFVLFLRTNADGKTQLFCGNDGGRDRD